MNAGRHGASLRGGIVSAAGGSCNLEPGAKPLENPNSLPTGRGRLFLRRPQGSIVLSLFYRTRGSARDQVGRDDNVTGFPVVGLLDFLDQQPRGLGAQLPEILSKGRERI